MTSELKEKKIIELLQAHSHEGFDLLYDNYAGMLFAITLRIVKDKNIAIDLLGEIFVKIWKDVALYSNQNGSFEMWLLLIARDLCLDYKKTQGGIEVNEQGTHKWLTWIDEMLPQQKQVMDLVLIHGHSNEKVALELGMDGDEVTRIVLNTLHRLKTTYK